MQILTPVSTNEFPMPEPVLSADEAVLTNAFPVIVPESTNEFPMPPVVTQFYETGAELVEQASVEPAVDEKAVTAEVVDTKIVEASAKSTAKK